MRPVEDYRQGAGALETRWRPLGGSSSGCGIYDAKPAAAPGFDAGASADGSPVTSTATCLIRSRWRWPRAWCTPSPSRCGGRCPRHGVRTGVAGKRVTSPYAALAGPVGVGEEPRHRWPHGRRRGCDRHQDAQRDRARPRATVVRLQAVQRSVMRLGPMLVVISRRLPRRCVKMPAARAIVECRHGMVDPR